MDIIETFGIMIDVDGKNVDRELSSVVGNVKNKLSDLMLNVVTPVITGLASGQLVQQFTDEILQVDRLSKTLGVNIEQLQAWQGAAEAAGVAADEVGELFADLNDWMIDSAVNDSGALNDFIKLGILPSVVDAQGELKTTEKYALELAEAFRLMGGQKASGIGRQIGISQNAMVGFLAQGSASINSQLDYVKKLGVYTEEDTKAAREFANASSDLSKSLKMLLLPAYRFIAPLLSKVADGISYLSRHTALLIPLIAVLANVVKAKLLNSVIELAQASKAFIFSPWGALTMALIAIGVILDDLIGWINGDEAAFSDFWNMLFGNAENAKIILNEFIEQAKRLTEIAVYGGSVIGILYGISTALSVIQQGIAMIRGAMTALNMIAMLSGWGLALSAIVAAILLVVDNWDYLMSAFKKGIAWLQEKLSALKDFISIGGTLNKVLNKEVSVADLVRPNGGSVDNSNNSTHTNSVNQNITIYGAQDPSATKAEIVAAARAGYFVNNNNNAY
jgi:hypothetical protein